MQYSSVYDQLHCTGIFRTTPVVHMTFCLQSVAQVGWHRVALAHCVIDIAPRLMAVTHSKQIHITPTHNC
jgi:hypothetical protein